MIQVASKYTSFINRHNGTNSRQPRFGKVSPNQFFTSLLKFVNESIYNEPEYGSPQRDTWLRQIWPQEPYLAGVINSVTQIDKNRGWTMTGGRNQVRRFTKMLHERFHFMSDLAGWRISFGGGSQAYYTSDLGVVYEIGRNGKGGPIDSLYFVDPTRCSLTGDFDTPLKYRPTSGSKQKWEWNDYFRIVSMPSTDESKYGLGLCALSRCVELAKIMIGIYQYDNEMLLNQAPRGLLLLKGITETQWEEAMTTRKAKLEGDEKKYYGALHVLAQVDPGTEIEAQLVALSSLPAEFDQRTFTDMLMFGYALVFGYDPREFWPVSSGALGTATETETQHRKAGGKGGLDFALGFAEKLQDELPDTIQFEFEERDLDGELANAEVEMAKAKVVTILYESGLREAAPLLSTEEGRILLAERGLIDPEWTENQEEMVSTDTEDDTARALSNERVQRAIWQYPDEPIVQYRFAIENGKEQHQWRTLLEPCQMAKMHKFYSIGRMVKRQASVNDELTTYQQRINELAQQANEGEISQYEFGRAMEGATLAALLLSLIRGIETTNEATTVLESAANEMLEGNITDENLDTLTDATILSDALPQSALDVLAQKIEDSQQSNLAQDIYAGKYTDNAQGLLSRLEMWRNTALGVFYLGQMIGWPERHFQWRRNPVKESCRDCLRLNGQIHKGKEWLASGWSPRSHLLECSGANCGCHLYEVDLPISGGF